MKTYLTAGLAAVLLAALAYIYHLGGERALLQQRLHASDSTLAVLAQRAAVVDTVYKRDTIRLTRTVTQWERVKAEVETVTVAVPVEVVKTVVQTADNAIRACTLVVETCEQRVAVRDSLIATLRAQRPLLIGNKEGRFKRTVKTLGWVGIGVGGGYIVGKYATHP